MSNLPNTSADIHVEAWVENNEAAQSVVAILLYEEHNELLLKIFEDVFREARHEIQHLDTAVSDVAVF